MRYILLSLLCAMLSTVQAQIHQPDQRFVEVDAGFTNGVPLQKKANSGYWLKASLGKYGKKEGIYQVGLMTQRKYYQSVESLIAVHQYFLEGVYAPKVFTTANRQLYLHPALGLLAGYEGTRAGVNYMRDTMSVRINKALVGITGGLYGEWNLSSETAFILFTRINYLPSSAIEPFHFQYGIGLRFNYFKL